MLNIINYFLYNFDIISVINKQLLIKIMTSNFSYYKDQQPGKEGEDYKDDLFPPTENSLLGLDSNGNTIDQEAYDKAIGGLIKKDEIEFKRAHEIYKDTRYTLIADNMKMDDIVPGQIDDIYFLFAVQNLCKNPGNINNYLLRMEVIITLMAIMN